MSINEEQNHFVLGKACLSRKHINDKPMIIMAIYGTGPWLELLC
jgi:hypothetical protein